MDNFIWVLAFYNGERFLYYRGTDKHYDDFIGMSTKISDATKFDTFSEAVDLSDGYSVRAIPMTEADYAKELLIGQ